MLPVVEFQTAVTPAAREWEIQARFVLIDGRVRVITRPDVATQEEVEDLVAQISEASKLAPETGEAFLAACATFEEGSRWARTTDVFSMSRDQALSSQGMVSIGDEDDDEPTMELMGHIESVIRSLR